MVLNALLLNTFIATPQIGMILDNLVDVGMSDFYATAQRGEVVDFSSIVGVAP